MQIFHKTQKNELTHVINLTLESVESAIKSIETNSWEEVQNVRKCEEEIDDLQDKYKVEHIKRLASGACKAISGIVFLDTIGNLERISDHANNLADYVEAEIKNNI